MSNVIQFQSKPKRTGEPTPSAHVDAAFPVPVKAALLRSNAKDTLTLLANQLETAMHHARAIEPSLRDRETRQAFGDRIEIVQRMLDIARLKILQL